MDDPEGGGAWLTKAELAEARGITIASATRMIRRQGWRRQPGNDGRVRVFVPQGQSDPRPQVRPEGTPQVTPEDGEESDHRAAPKVTPGSALSLSEAFSAALAEIREAHAGEVATLRDQLARERATADVAEAAVTELRLRTEGLTVRLDEAEERVERALATAKDALATAEAETMARAEADAAEARVRLDAAEALASSATAGLVEEQKARAEAEERARNARREAEELRQAQAARAGQGRWARLRTAWRGD
jgi:hypothetical protein